MNVKKLVAILAGITLVAFGIAFLSYNLSGQQLGLNINHRNKWNNHSGKDFKGLNIDADGSQVKIGFSGIHVKDEDGTEVKISPSGVYVNDGGEVVDISPNGVYVNGEEVDPDEYDDFSWNGDCENINTSKSENITDVKDIVVETSFVDVNFIPDDRSDVKINYIGKINSNHIPKLKTKISGNTLYIYAKNDKLIKPFSVNYSDLKLDIYVPKNYSNNINIISTSGDIDISKMDFNDLNISTVSGDIYLNDLKFKNVVVNTTSGDLDSLNISSDEFVFNSTSGDIEVKDAIGDMQLNTTSGDIEISYKDYNNDISAKTVSGDLKLILPKSSDFQLEAKTVSGELRCNFPITVKEKQKNTLVGTVGSGKNKIDIGTTSGDLNIYSK